MTSTLSMRGRVDVFLLGGFNLNSKIANYFSIAFFAFFGGIARAALNTNFSYNGTFWGNIIGCFLLAFLTYFFIETKEMRQWLTVGLGTGFVGAFTTFSTFNLDILKNIQANLPIEAIIYYFCSIVFGFIFAMMGMSLGKKIGRLVREERSSR